MDQYHDLYRGYPIKIKHNHTRGWFAYVFVPPDHNWRIYPPFYESYSHIVSGGLTWNRVYEVGMDFLYGDLTLPEDEYAHVRRHVEQLVDFMADTVGKHGMPLDEARICTRQQIDEYNRDQDAQPLDAGLPSLPPSYMTAMTEEEALYEWMLR